MNDKEMLDKVTETSAIIGVCKDILEAKNRDNRRLFIALIVSICLNLAVFVGFLIYEGSYDYADNYSIQNTEVQQDTSGSNSDIINGDQYNGSK